MPYFASNICQRHTLQVIFATARACHSQGATAKQPQPGGHSQGAEKRAKTLYLEMPNQYLRICDFRYCSINASSFPAFWAFRMPTLGIEMYELRVLYISIITTFCKAHTREIISDGRSSNALYTPSDKSSTVQKSRRAARTPHALNNARSR